eukprot:TRINITY_DN4595_c0_g1_i1.p1 TRINITY_DN4595_c0_g1~~TRINITY_DN4595_c0_g1_i1.p1  ORF type:complete len:260 (+),score=55.76 TRINITY_DN4595_c0_g1_i1:52-780(+)
MEGGSPARKINWADYDSDDDDFGNPLEMYEDFPAIEPCRMREDEKAKAREEEARRAEKEAVVRKKLKAIEMAGSTPARQMYSESPVQHSLSMCSMTPITPVQISPATPLPTPPSVTRRAIRLEAQQQLIAVLGKHESMDAQELSKALEWKKTYYRTLGSLYAFVKRDCKDLLSYDPKGRVRIASCPPSPSPSYLPQYSPMTSSRQSSMQPVMHFPDTPVILSRGKVDDEITEIAKSLLSMQW